MPNLHQTTLDYLAAKATAEAAEAAKKKAEADLKLAFATAGVEFYVADGRKVTITSKVRRTVDAAALMGMVSKAVFRRVVKEAIDMKKFDAAVEIGQITPEVADSATKNTEYAEVRVTDVAKNAEGIATEQVA